MAAALLAVASVAVYPHQALEKLHAWSLDSAKYLLVVASINYTIQPLKRDRQHTQYVRQSSQATSCSKRACERLQPLKTYQ